MAQRRPVEAGKVLAAESKAPLVLCRNLVRKSARDAEYMCMYIHVHTAMRYLLNHLLVRTVLDCSVSVMFSSSSL